MQKTINNSDLRKKSLKYTVFPFVIQIKYSIENNGYVYYYSILEDNNIKKINEIYTLLTPHIVENMYATFSDFSVLIENLKNSIKQSILRVFKKINIDQKNFDLILLYLAFKIINLDKILPFLLDRHVNEIYLDCPKCSIYIDHSIFGRIETGIVLNNIELKRLKTLIFIQSDSIISYQNPSTKLDIITKYFHLRISADFYPLTTNRFTLTIRKLKNDSPAPTLFLRSKTNILQMTILFLMIALRGNIIILGEPGSGKTTLATLLASVAPSFWRIFCIEDVKEFPDIRKYNKKFIRLKIESYEADYKSKAKEREIIKLLHRSPDYVVLGEIQTREHNNAMFHAFSAGLHGLATIHSKGIDEIFDRWINTFKISIDRVYNIDLIVLMNRKITPFFIKREINTIYLILDENRLRYISLFPMEKLKITKKKHVILLDLINFWETFGTEKTIELLLSEHDDSKRLKDNVVMFVKNLLNILFDIYNSRREPKRKEICEILSRITEIIEQIFILIGE